ncbi:NADP-dependent oxidoreductase [Cohnella nanjingensis]|uniref:NADP-dependent oxidoreductase n=1 Tax=Cohnella nanjingensis TaxID=1387779 RepID=A0A7X0RT86_9BACL|nr:NADP-dependent oxidoreductase [Cohnella nanjingensis]MBB6672061.1 NADP-dependent oxidoreductase [Cohnella nanjingensis]
MRAMAAVSFGSPEVLTLIELPDPQAGPGEVRVRVMAAGVMPFDCGIRRGEPPASLKPRLPVVPGNEFAGVIDQVGDGVTDFAAGDEVLGFTMLNGYAEYVTVGADQIVRKPPGMPWAVAGGFSGNTQGAHMALRALDVGAGDTVLIHGAAGGLGTAAIQVALAWGAKTVIGTASEPNHDYLRSLGAIPVRYGDGLAERVREIAPDGVDAVLDAAGPEALQASVALVKDLNQIRTMVSFELAQALGVPSLSGTRTAERLRGLVDLYALGKLKIHLRQVLPLHRAADAHRMVESGHGRGKIVLSVG